MSLIKLKLISAIKSETKFDLITKINTKYQQVSDKTKIHTDNKIQTVYSLNENQSN